MSSAQPLPHEDHLRRQQGLKLANESRILFHSPTPLIPPPYLSNFVVSCAVLYTTKTKAEGGEERIAEEWKTATNSEPCSLTGSICSERAALSSLYPSVPSLHNILSISIVSDSPLPITPGSLCREYMSTRFPPNILDPSTFKIHIAGTTGKSVNWSTVKTATLKSLYPALTIYSCIPVSNLPLSLPPQLPPNLPASLLTLYTALSNHLKTPLSTLLFPSESYHRVKYAAGIIFKDGSIIKNLSVTGLEYGTSLDPVSMCSVDLTKRVASDIPCPSPSPPTSSEGLTLPPSCVISHCLMVDDRGIIHAPFAVGRAWLTELNDEFIKDGMCWYHERGKDGGMNVKGIRIKELVPGVPQFKVEDLA